MLRVLRIAVIGLAIVGLPLWAVAEGDNTNNVMDLPSKEELLKIQKTDRVLGNPDSKVRVIEYASMSCSHCAAFHNNTYPELYEEFIATKKIAFIFRDFPLDERALRASMLLRCASDDKYEKFVKVIFRTQSNWVDKKNYIEILSNIAKLGGMKGEEFDACLKDKDLERDILQSRLAASKILEVRSTPTFLVNGEKVEGSYKYQYFKDRINELLGEDASKDVSGSETKAKHN